MNELFPVSAGVLVGLGIWRIATPRLRLGVLVLASIVLGFTASLISGELELSFGFIPVDVAQVLLVSSLTSVAVVAWQHRPARAGSR